jgi:hypothetical protein
MTQFCVVRDSRVIVAVIQAVSTQFQSWCFQPRDITVNTLGWNYGPVTAGLIWTGPHSAPAAGSQFHLYPLGVGALRNEFFPP